MRWFECVLATLLISIKLVCQVPSSICDAVNPTFSPCGGNQGMLSGAASFSKKGVVADGEPAHGSQAFASTRPAKDKQGVHWGRMLLETFELFSIEQAYVVHDDWGWVAGKHSENGVPFNHYWRDYKQSLSAWVHSGWNDGDPNLYGYVGHPVQGVATSYIFLQNDPKSQRVEFSRTKQYWQSRLKATVWNAIYSTQWNLGPLSEPTIEKYGTKWRSPWNQNGTWPCNTKHCYTGMGQIDLVMTPVGGLGWLVGEDILDRFVARRVESATRNRFLIDTTRCGLDPIRIGTNLLHGKRPWYRPRDMNEVYFTDSPTEIDAPRNQASVGASH